MAWEVNILYFFCKSKEGEGYPRGESPWRDKGSWFLGEGDPRARDLGGNWEGVEG